MGKSCKTLGFRSECSGWRTKNPLRLRMGSVNSEDGLYEEVDNDWLLNSEIFARLIFSDCLIIPKFKPKRGKKYYYLSYDLDDIANPEKLEILDTIFTDILDVSRYNIGNCFRNQTEAELCGSYVSKQINKMWEALA